MDPTHPSTRASFSATPSNIARAPVRSQPSDCAGYACIKLYEKPRLFWIKSLPTITTIIEYKSDI